MPPARIRRRRVASVMLLATLVLGVPAASRAVADPAPRPVTYVVQPGDTLWSIAVRLSPGSDPRGVVDAIARANDIDAARLFPGQELRLPS